MTITIGDGATNEDVLKLIFKKIYIIDDGFSNGVHINISRPNKVELSGFVTRDWLDSEYGKE